jgi:hypothetical protein
VLADPITLGIILWMNHERPVLNLRKIFAIPLLLAGAATAIGWALSLAIPHFRGDNIVRLAVITLVSGSIYLLLIPRLAPDDWHDVMSLRKSRST